MMVVVLWCLFWVGMFVVGLGGGWLLHRIVEWRSIRPKKRKPDYSGYTIEYDSGTYFVYFEGNRERSGDLWNFTATRTLTEAKRAIRRHWKAAHYGK